MITVSDRLTTIFLALKIKPSQFAREHEINRMTMYNVVIGKNRPNLDLLERICAAEPRVSAEYLMRGEGAPLRTERQTAILNTVVELKAFKAEMDRSLDQRIAELEAQSNG